jgi:hypothetical protein
MATECSARSGIAEGDDVAARWLAERRDATAEEIAAAFVTPDPGLTGSIVSQWRGSWTRWEL